MAPKDDDEDDYMFSRGYQDSARLVLQHWLWIYRLKYVLNPSIPAKDENLKIADVGTGNAVWLFELLAHIPASTQLDGFDISADHYPAKEWLPHNVTLDLFDAWGLPPIGRNGPHHVSTRRRQSLSLNGSSGRVHDQMEVRVRAIWHQIRVNDLTRFSRSLWPHNSDLVLNPMGSSWIPNLETIFREN